MSTARLLRAAGSAQQSAEHAEAAGACSSEPCRCWSHGELRHDLARLSIPGDSLARPSVRPWGTFSCRPTTPRAHATNSCMGPVAAAGLPPAPSRSRAQPVGYRTRWLFYCVKGQVSALSEKPNSGSFRRIRLTQARSPAARGTRSLAQPPAWGGPRKPCPRPGGVDRVRATI